jgi:uncharacterized protein (TIGR03083 family)
MDSDDLLSRSDQRFMQLARDLDDHEWAAPSLCSEWTNHEVLAHLVVGYSTPIGSIALRMLQRRGNFDATNTVLSRELAATRSPAALLDDFDHLRRHPRGIGRLFPGRLMLGDHVIHELDIVFALGRPSTIPVETLIAVLNTEVHIPNPFVPARRRSKGMHLHASDTPWDHRGDPTSRLVVRGSAADLASVLAGRPHALVRLTGTGVNTLRARIANAHELNRQ